MTLLKNMRREISEKLLYDGVSVTIALLMSIAVCGRVCKKKLVPMSQVSSGGGHKRSPLMHHATA